MSLFASIADPRVPSTHLKERRKFSQLFLSDRIPLLSKHPLPLLNLGEDFKAIAQKNPIETTFKDFQDETVSILEVVLIFHV